MKVFLKIQILLLLYTLIFIPKKIYANFLKYEANPIFSVSNDSYWNSKKNYAATILLDENNRYKIWFSGSNSVKRQIGYADSPNGINWYEYEDNPIIPSKNDTGFEHPSVLINFQNHPHQYYMWFNNVSNNFQNFELVYALSQDGTRWTEPITLIFDKTSDWDNQAKTAPAVISSGNSYLMWYTAKGSYQNKISWRIGYATSSDGINWQKYPEPVLWATEAWEKRAGDFGIGNPSVLFKEGIYHLWYHADRDIGHATSTDGIHWEKDPENPVLTPSGNENAFDYKRVMDPFVLEKDGIYYLFYTGVDIQDRWQIGLATSQPLSPPITLSPTISPAITPSLTPSPTLAPSPTQTPTPTITPSFTPSPSFSPSPTSIPSPSFSPIILLPGLGASWNPRAIFSCRLEPQEEWKIAPYVSLYKPLLKTLSENAHLKINEEVFVYPYDWRLPLEKQALNFRNFLQKLLEKKPAGTKVRLIGHSLGGLVIRSYLDHYPENHYVEKTITVGTPHQGTILAYPLWEKGEIWSDNVLMKIALNQVLTHCRFLRSINLPFFNLPLFTFPALKTKKEVIQEIVPVIKDLLPIFDYLRENGEIKPVQTLFSQNDWLLSHPFPENFYSTSFFTLSGTGISTLKLLNVSQPSKTEIKKQEWIDGKPISREKTKEGDGTVLLKSSYVLGAENKVIGADHGEIISSYEGQKEILQFLGLEKITPAVLEVPEEKGEIFLTISFSLPAKVQLITAKGELRENEEEILVLVNPEIGSYKIKIFPQQNGRAFLYFHQIEKDKDLNKSFSFKAFKDHSLSFSFFYRPETFPNINLDTP